MASKLKVQWRVEIRQSRRHKWVGKGLYETRSSAREQAAYLRDKRSLSANGGTYGAVGFGNTRVQRYFKGCK